jgi:hypothetical protein
LSRLLELYDGAILVGVDKPGLKLLYRCVSMDIVKSGIIETHDQLLEFTKQYGRIVIPGGDEDLDLTHWWVIREDGSDMLYIGTPETFTTYIRERNGGVQ